MALSKIITGVKGSVTIPKNTGAGDASGATSFQNPAGAFTAINAYVTRWTLEYNRERHDSTTFNNTTNFPDFIGGMADWLLTIEGFMDSVGILDVASFTTTDRKAMTSGTPDEDLCTVKLTDTTGVGYMGNGLIRNLRVGAVERTGGPIPFSATIRGTGDLTAPSTL